jgi:exonuclease SbcC
MLKRIKLKNFRSHKHTELQFHKGVNVIYGLGQSGKTNILRAINWVLYNRPSGFNIHSHFANVPETEVEIESTNGLILMVKNPKTTTYIVDNPELPEPQTFTYTGKSVPELVTRILNINEINISNQLDAPFLITDSPGEVGKTINRITKVEQIDSWVSKLTTKVNSTRSKIEIYQEEINKSKQELTFYEGLDELESQINFFNKIEKVIENKESKIYRLDKILTQWHGLRLTIESIDITGLQELFDEVQELTNEIHTKQFQLNRILSLINHINENKELINELSTVIESIEPKFTEIETINKKLSYTMIKFKLIQNYCNQRDALNTFMQKTAQYKAEYLALIKELGICPVCKNSITEIHLKELTETL